MSNDKPKNTDEYKKWLLEAHKIDVSNRTDNHYETVANKIKRDFEKNAFWVNLKNHIREIESEYLVKTGYHLLIPRFKPDLLTKPFESFLLKTFRINILENKNWPEEPPRGWVLPSNWFFRINDIVRTFFVVKYLDGVEFLIYKLQSICSEYSLKCEPSFKAEEEGYYAAHLDIEEKFEIPKFNFDTETVTVSIEFQITTQLQEVIKKLLHKHYEKRRKKVEETDIKWQWDYKSEEFSTNYLGHILHFIEGMIVDIREKQKGIKNDDYKVQKLS